MIYQVCQLWLCSRNCYDNRLIQRQGSGQKVGGLTKRNLHKEYLNTSWNIWKLPATKVVSGATHDLVVLFEEGSKLFVDIYSVLLGLHLSVQKPSKMSKHWKYKTNLFSDLDCSGTEINSGTYMVWLDDRQLAWVPILPSWIDTNHWNRYKTQKTNKAHAGATFRLLRLPQPKPLKGQRASTRLEFVRTCSLAGEKKYQFSKTFALFKLKSLIKMKKTLGYPTKWANKPSSRESSLFCVRRNSDSMASSRSYC